MYVIKGFTNSFRVMNTFAKYKLGQNTKHSLISECEKLPLSKVEIIIEKVKLATTKV